MPTLQFSGESFIWVQFCLEMELKFTSSHKHIILYFLCKQISLKNDHHFFQIKIKSFLKRGLEKPVARNKSHNTCDSTEVI